MAAAAGEEQKLPEDEDEIALSPSARRLVSPSFEPVPVPVLSPEDFGASLLSTLTLNVTPSRRSASFSSTCWFGIASVGGVAQTAGMGAWQNVDRS